MKNENAKQKIIESIIFMCHSAFTREKYYGNINEGRESYARKLVNVNNFISKKYV